MDISERGTQNEKDILCIDKVLSGDKNAFRALVESYERRLRSFCRSRLPEKEIDDSMQEIFVKTYRNLKKFHRDQNFAAWFFTIAFNTIAGRKLKFKREIEKKEQLTIFAHKIPSHNEGQAHLEAEFIRNCVKKLKTDNRSVVELYYFAELDVGQISKALSIGESSVKTRLFRARKELRKYLEECNL